MAQKKYSQKTPALDQLDDYVKNKYKKEKEKIKKMYVKRDVEKAHAQYLRTQKVSYDDDDNIWNNCSQSPFGLGQQQRDGQAGISRSLAMLEVAPHGTAVQSSQVDHADVGLVRDVNLDQMPLLLEEFSYPGSRNMTDEEHLAKCLKLSRQSANQRVEPETIHTCPIEQCGAYFSSRRKLRNHLLTYDEHSPCHPYKHLLDLEFSFNVKEYRCPTCFRKSKSLSSCMSHMMAQDHNILELFKPVQIAAYACPECFLVYPDGVSCRQHIAEANHVNYTLRFKGDPAVADPLLLSAGVLEQYIVACREAEYHLECLHCACKIQPEQDSIKHHVKEGHTVMALTEKSLVDVFSTFQRKYTCACCQMLFQDLPPGGLEARHQCDNNHVGMIVENNCSSSMEFMLRLALHRPASTKLEFPDSVKLEAIHLDQSENSFSKTGKSEGTAESATNSLLGVAQTCCQMKSSINKSIDSGSLVDSCNVENDGNVSLMSRRKRHLAQGDRPKNEVSKIKRVKYQADNSLLEKTQDKCVSKKDSKVSSGSRTMTMPKLVEAPQSQNVKSSEMSEAINYDFTGNSPSRQDHKVQNSDDQKHGMHAIVHKTKQALQNGTIPNNIEKMNQILFLDLNEFPQFFQTLPCPLEDSTFVWAFSGMKNGWTEPTGCLAYDHAVANHCFHLQRGPNMDAIHIKIALNIGRLDERLPKSIIFSILSGDRGFSELGEQLEMSERCTVFINPHDQKGDDLYKLIYKMTNT